jgi:hypothetical protein
MGTDSGPGDSPARGELTDVRGLAFGSGGLVLVADAGENRISVFDSLGHLLYTIGRDGSGPGDLRSPCCISTTADAHLWVKEDGNRRYSEFVVDPSSAQYVRSISMPNGGSGLFDRISWSNGGLVHIGAAGVDSSGRFLFARNVLQRSGAWAAIDTILSPLPESLGAVVKRTIHGAGSAGLSVLQLPFSPRALWAFGPGTQYAQVISSSYDVTVFGPHRAHAWDATRRLPVRGLSDSQRQYAADIRALIARRDPDNAKRLAIPSARPQVENLCADPDGRLWVQFASPLPAMRMADVYDSAGRLLTTRAWPDTVDMSLCAARGTQALGLVSDSVGIERAVLLQFSDSLARP